MFYKLLKRNGKLYQNDLVFLECGTEIMKTRTKQGLSMGV